MACAFKQLAYQIFLFLVLITSLSAELTETSHEKKWENGTPISRVMQDNQESFEKFSRNVNCNSRLESLKTWFKIRSNPRPDTKRENAFDMLRESTHNQHENWSNYKHLSLQAGRDLHLFKGDDRRDPYLANIINRADSELGSASLLLMLNEPLTDTSKLRERQSEIKTLVADRALYKALREQTKIIGKHEALVLDMWSQFFRSFFKNKDRDNYFKTPLTKSFNKSPEALWLGSSWDRLQAIVFPILDIWSLYALLAYAGYSFSGAIKPAKKPTAESQENQVGRPDGIDSTRLLRAEDAEWVNNHRGAAGPINEIIWDKLRNKWVHGGLSLLSAYFLYYRLKWDSERLRALFLQEKQFQIIASHVTRTIRACEKMGVLIQQHPVLARDERLRPLIDTFDSAHPDAKKIRELLRLSKTGTFAGTPKIWSHKGRVLRAYMLIKDLIAPLRELFVAGGRLDAYCSLATLYNEASLTGHSTDPSMQLPGENQDPGSLQAEWCFPEYLDQEKPEVALNNFWNPFVDRKKVVTNSIHLGGKERQNMILTGPNAAGKSTVMRGIILSIILAQTCGIAPAQSMRFTPYSLIETYLNIKDDIGKGNSLFKSEVLRAQELLTRINSLKWGEKSFTIFDELFSGTSPKEGESTAYAVAESLGALSQSTVLMASHFPKFKELYKEQPSFAPYKVTVQFDQNNKIDYPFRLVPGVSDQHVAIDILREEGFSPRILRRAQELVIQE